MRELAYGTAGIACRDASWTVLKETKVTERFTEHDLRAKCAPDGESLEHARALLSHADASQQKRSTAQTRAD
jgi:hypothetical protein